MISPMRGRYPPDHGVDPEDTNHTYPTIVGGRIVEMTGAQRYALVMKMQTPQEKLLSLDQRILRIEQYLGIA